MARLLVVGDLHFCERSAKIIPLLVDEVHRVIDEEQPDGVVFLGDTLDRFRNIDSIWHGLATDFIIGVSQRVPVLLLIGNHDIPNKNHFLSDEHGFHALYYIPNIVVADNQPMVFTVKGQDFLGVPYCPNGRFAEALGYYKPGLDNITAVFAHQEFSGCIYNNKPSKHGDPWPWKKPCYSGHIHHHHKVGEYLTYIGTPYQDKSNENLDKSISLLDFTKDEIVEKRIYLNLPKKYRLTLNVEEYAALTLEEGNIYYVDVTGLESELALHRNGAKSYDIIDGGGRVFFRAIDNVSAGVMIDKFVSVKELLDGLVEERPYLAWVHRRIYNN